MVNLYMSYLQHISAVLDPGVLKESYGTAILDGFQKQEVRYDIQPQAVPNIITYWREVTELVDKGPGQVSLWS